MSGGIRTVEILDDLSAPTAATATLRSPRQASQIFSLGTSAALGAHAPRQKNLFVVNFKKSGDSSGSLGTGSTTTGTTSGNWTKQLGFMVKSVDRPSFEPKVEELNQYNKKRLVHTGYKIGQTRIVLYDTSDSMAMQMWNEYANYYFGDFRHYQSRTDWNLDTTSNTFNGKDTGFGFAPQSSTSTALGTTGDLSVPFFFDSISVYQVFGGNFVQFDLINPKIVTFDPDELDYSNSEVATFTMVVQAEAVLYVNNFKPSPISGDAFLAEAFGNITEFDGDVADYANSAQASSPASYSYSTSSPLADVTQYSQALYGPQSVAPAVPLQTFDYSTGAGSLGAYGQYNFGTTTSAGFASTRSLTQDIALLASGNPALASILTVAQQTQGSSLAPIVQQLIQPYSPPTYISQDAYDEARNAVSAIGQSIGNLDTSSAIGQQVVYGILSAALATGTASRDQMYNRKPPGDTSAPNSWSSNSAQGLALTNETYGILNAQSSGCVQMGFNTANAIPRQYAPQVGSVQIASDYQPIYQSTVDGSLLSPAVNVSSTVYNVNAPGTVSQPPLIQVIKD